MTKVYPNFVGSALAATASAAAYEAEQKRRASGSEEATVLTVWKKSLLLNCNGFTVFDTNGNLVFRVDNYLSGRKGEIVLMDAHGKCLLAIRRKRLSLGDNWVVYDGDTTEDPRFCVRKNVNMLNNKYLAQVCYKNSVLYQMEGSYAQRSCVVYDGKRRKVAEIKRKEAAVGGVALGIDVFRLDVQPDLDTPVAMAFVILLEQMYGSSRR